jgi:hypothetical protein
LQVALHELGLQKTALVPADWATAVANWLLFSLFVPLNDGANSHLIELEGALLLKQGILCKC